MPRCDDDGNARAERISYQMCVRHAGRVHRGHDVAGKVVSRKWRARVGGFVGTAGVEQQAAKAGREPAHHPGPCTAIGEGARNQDQVRPAPKQLVRGSHPVIFTGQSGYLGPPGR
jgi:hypothetical protein